MNNFYFKPANYLRSKELKNIYSVFNRRHKTKPWLNQKWIKTNWPQTSRNLTWNKNLTKSHLDKENWLASLTLPPNEAKVWLAKKKKISKNNRKALGKHSLSEETFGCRRQGAAIRISTLKFFSSKWKPAVSGKALKFSLDENRKANFTSNDWSVVSCEWLSDCRAKLQGKSNASIWIEINTQHWLELKIKSCEDECCQFVSRDINKYKNRRNYEDNRLDCR